ncbi:EHT1 [Candida pseudojiufengensis]|uniref:EHT1 n=1 Tax=Candida pseudojiufengensis TaxID=497109 RepID=UPI0022259D36|nr:EHT1 [Candida pseudojiufengensis]KAI5966255.1 EHT1 [Candida pseudojiufengensis]
MSILKWGFRTDVKLHQVPEDNAVELNSKDKISFNQFISTLKTIDSSKKLWLNPLLFNGSLQTLHYTSSNNSKKFLIWYGREIFKYKDGGICSLDWVIEKPESKEEFNKIYEETLPEGFPKLHPRTRYFTKEELETLNEPSTNNDKPIVVILHGLGGGSHEAMIRNFAEVIQKNTEGWDIVVINNRGCCRTKVTSEKLFNAAATDDIREVLTSFKSKWPNRKIFTAGFSFGAAMLSNFLGEEGENGSEPLVDAACVVGCPWDLIDSAYHIENSYTGKYLLGPGLTGFLTKIIKNNYKEIHDHNPDLVNEEVMKKLKTIKSTWQFDDLITCKTSNFKNAFEYYRESSPQRKILNIKTPTLIINSNDDPAVSCRLPILDCKTNPYLCMVETDLGGHLGYVQSNGEFWSVKVAEEFFQRFSEL